MINHGKVRSTERPERIIIDDYSVWVHENIQEIEVEDIVMLDEVEEIQTTTMYEYDMIQYTKDEYILMQSEQTTDLEMAMVELYESLGV